MTSLSNQAQGWGLALLTKIAGSQLIDQLHMRKALEKALYQGTRKSFSTLSRTQKIFKSQPAQHQQRLTYQKKFLFDLNLTEDQQFICTTLGKFSHEILYPLAREADQQEQFPAQLWQYALELGLNNYALPEAYAGVTAQKDMLTHLLIAEQLGQGDFSLAAGLLCHFSVINCITQWGSQQIQAEYLATFAAQADVRGTFAVQENTAAFNPMQLQTQASSNHQGTFYIQGEKTLVLLGETTDVYLVTAMFNLKPELFIVKRDDSIQVKKSPAMGLKATETVTLYFNHSPAQRLGDADFDYVAFLDFGHLMWCALALGCCHAVKNYCIDYANTRYAFGEPISHRQSVAFMIADMAIEIEAMRLLLLNTASCAEAGLPFHRETYLARLLCVEKTMKIATDGVQILGGHGYTKEHPVERWYRDLRATAILHSGLHA